MLQLCTTSLPLRSLTTAGRVESPVSIGEDSRRCSGNRLAACVHSGILAHDLGAGACARVASRPDIGFPLFHSPSERAAPAVSTEERVGTRGREFTTL